MPGVHGLRKGRERWGRKWAKGFPVYAWTQEFGFHATFASARAVAVICVSQVIWAKYFEIRALDAADSRCCGRIKVLKGLNWLADIIVI